MCVQQYSVWRILLHFPGAVYISTEETIPTSRTMDIAQYIKSEYGSEVDHINFNDNIFIKEVFTEVSSLHFTFSIQLAILSIILYFRYFESSQQF